MSFLYKWAWFEIDHGRQIDDLLMVYSIPWIKCLMMLYWFTLSFIFFFTADAGLECFLLEKRTASPKEYSLGCFFDSLGGLEFIP